MSPTGESNGGTGAKWSSTPAAAQILAMPTPFAAARASRPSGTVLTRVMPPLSTMVIASARAPAASSRARTADGSGPTSGRDAAEPRQPASIRREHLVQQGLRLLEIECGLGVGVEQEGVQRGPAVTAQGGVDDLPLKRHVPAQVCGQRLAQGAGVDRVDA